MNALTTGIAATALFLGIATCQAQPAPTLTVEVDDSTRLMLTRIEYEPTATGIVVSGRVAKPDERRGRILGHVDITLLDAQGRIVARHRAALQRFTPSRQNPDWAGFSTRIEPLPAGVTGLRLGYSLGG